jgi:hypothetical protein
VGGADNRADGSYRGKISIYSVARGFSERPQLLPEDLEPPNTVFDCSFSADGRYLAWGGYGQQLTVVRLGEIKERLTKRADGSSHSKLIVARRPKLAFQRGFYVDKEAAGKHETVDAVTFSACGNFLAALTHTGKLSIDQCEVPGDWETARQIFANTVSHHLSTTEVSLRHAISHWQDSFKKLERADSHNNAQPNNSASGKPEVQAHAARFSQRPEDGSCCSYIAVALLNGLITIRTMPKTRVKEFPSDLEHDLELTYCPVTCIIDDDPTIPKCTLQFMPDSVGLIVCATKSGIAIYHAESGAVACKFPDSNQPFCLALSKSCKGFAYGEWCATS